jgi:hypothetical protein
MEGEGISLLCFLEVGISAVELGRA